MLHLGRDYLLYNFSPDNEPAIWVDPGATIQLETEDAGSGQIRRPEDVHTYVSRPDYTNPTTGPIYVNDALPGDTLSVEIIDIQPSETGYTRLSPTAGLLRGEVPSPAAQIWHVWRQEGTWWAQWQELRLPVRPMVGTIGTAPAAGLIQNNLPGPHGGNMDVPALAEGATLYLPVRVPGALLAMGDVHANQGDGEISNVALEVQARVTIRVDLLRGCVWPRPWAETPVAWITIADAPEPREAMELATRDMLALLGERLSLSPSDSLMYLSLAGDMRPGQSSFSPGVNVTFYLSAPKPAHDLDRPWA